MMIKPLFALDSKSPRRTAAVGNAIGEAATGGLIVALSGPLGAGKTHLAQGIARGLGVDEPLASPTYLLERTYQGRLPLHHFDFYRLESEDDLESIGFYDLVLDSSDAVVVIEWAEKFPSALEPPVLHIDIAPQADNSRRISLGADGIDESWFAELTRKLSR